MFLINPLHCVINGVGGNGNGIVCLIVPRVPESEVQTHRVMGFKVERLRTVLLSDTVYHTIATHSTLHSARCITQ